MAKRGGARPGSGRKKGVPSVPHFRDYVSDEERKKFVEFILESYMGDMRLTTWMGDQLFGKAPQSHDLTSGGEKLPTPIMNVFINNGDEEDTAA